MIFDGSRIILLFLLGLMVTMSGCHSSVHQVDLDPTDHIRYGVGFGTPGGGGFELSINGNGMVGYRYITPPNDKGVNEEMSRPLHLSAEETQQVFQDLVDAGLLELRGQSARGGVADFGSSSITATIDGHTVSAVILGQMQSTRNLKRWQRVTSSLELLIKKIHPERWQASTSDGDIKSNQ